MKFIEPNWNAPASIKAYTTVRNSWGERLPYHDTHQGYYSSNSEENLLLKNLFHVPETPIWIKQTHSTIALAATPENREQIADATYTNEANRVCIVLTADCLPVLICNQQGTQVAAIHAGWRGLAGGIIERTLEKLNQPGEELLVWLGPAIGPNKFEVGKDVYDAFVNQHSEASAAFIPHQEGKWLANLYELAKLRLKQQGISQIYGGDHCTYTEDDLFFSYRRDNGKTGRMASLIWIDQK